MAEELTGRCSCGAIRYRLRGAPLFVHCCHCKDCQRQTGSAFVLNALIEADRVEVLSGAPEPITMPTESGRPHDIYRCPACKIAVWSTYGGRPQIRFVRVGTLDEPDRLPPDIHIFTGSKQPWVVLPQGTPAVAEYYDRNEHWPAESLARRDALMATTRGR